MKYEIKELSVSQYEADFIKENFATMTQKQIAEKLSIKLDRVQRNMKYLKIVCIKKDVLG